MDDRKIFELTRLKLAYQKQTVFMTSLIVLIILGIILYVFNIYTFDFALFIVAVVIIFSGIIFRKIAGKSEQSGHIQARNKRWKKWRET